jgi:ATP-dependent Zn protease
VLDYAIKIIRVPDKNSLQSKYDVGIVQAYSELADEVASKKGVELKNTIKSETNWIVKIITWIVYIGTILVIWAYIFRPILSRLIGNREKSGY